MVRVRLLNAHLAHIAVSVGTLDSLPACYYTTTTIPTNPLHSHQPQPPQIVLLRDWHINNDEMTKAAIRSSNIVINLIGGSLETRNFSFEDIHTAWPEKLAKMVADNAKTGGGAWCVCVWVVFGLLCHNT